MTYPPVDAAKLEGNRVRFELPHLLQAQALAWEGLRRTRADLRPGMTEGEIRKRGEAILAELGATKQWHRVVVRIDESTLLKFSEPANPDQRLGAESIVFLDLGPVFEFDGVAYEGDVGATFVMGEDPEKLRVVEASRTLFAKVAAIWREESISGEELYRRASEEALKMGVVLHPDVDGHRAGDFPHQVFFRGGIGELGFRPSAGVWILEIQIRHPTLPFGAFYEDTLI